MVVFSGGWLLLLLLLTAATATFAWRMREGGRGAAWLLQWTPTRHSTPASSLGENEVDAVTKVLLWQTGDNLGQSKFIREREEFIMQQQQQPDFFSTPFIILLLLLSSLFSLVMSVDRVNWKR
jgi:hypothetical protein